MYGSRRDQERYLRQVHVIDVSSPSTAKRMERKAALSYAPLKSYLNTEFDFSLHQSNIQKIHTEWDSGFTYFVINIYEEVLISYLVR